MGMKYSAIALCWSYQIDSVEDRIAEDFVKINSYVKWKNYYLGELFIYLNNYQPDSLFSKR